MFKKQRYTFKVDPVSKKIEKPKIYLCDRQLRKKGEIHPTISPVIKVNLNGADEISFSVKKKITNYNSSDANILRKKYGIDVGNKISTEYNNINDYSIVLAEGFGYFEVSPTIVDNSNTEKRINGNSLGESELSQLQCKLECNTELDHKTNGFTPTIICSTENKNKSLIHRILSFAPTYTVGEVDDSIASLQRTFTFDEDIISCFKKISEEINCIFDVIVERAEDGSVIRKVNIYDTQCCKDCGSRNIIGGVCQNQNCGSVNTNQIGEDTTILISTENLSNEITLTPGGNMKNCLIIGGGDELITDTIKGLSPSNTNKLYMFSDETKSQWSSELRSKYSEYVNTVSESEKVYAKTLELKYDIFDLISYLQSSRMPTVQTDKIDLHKEVQYIIEQFKKNFPNGIGIEENLSSASSKNSVVLNTFSIFVDKGYSLKQEDGNYHNGKWTGKLIVYESRNSEVKATINVNEHDSLIDFSTTGQQVNSYFTISFTNDCESYIKRMVALITESYEYIEEDEDKEWQKYSLNRLYSYYCGYDTCIQELIDLKETSSLDGVKSKAEDFITLYNQKKQEISGYMKKIENFLYYLYEYSGSLLSWSSNTPSFQDIDYKNYAKNPDNLIYKTPEEAFSNMVEYIKFGTFIGDPEEKKQNTDSALYCSNCRSTKVTLDGCPQCKRTDTIITYGSLAETILENHKKNPVDLESQREEIRNLCDLKKVLGDILYNEFFSFVREDKYENTNFVSDGLSNIDLINNTKDLIQKAKNELSKACISQHTISGDVHSFVAHSALNKNDFPIENIYDKFRLGNFMRYFADDGKTYKLRLSSEEFSWTDSGAELKVEFTDVIRYLGGGISDLSSLIEKVGSLATTANTAKTQADKGVQVSKEFQKIKDEGLQSALSNVLSARNIDVQIDERGILLRKYNYDLDDYDQYQMKLINRNIVMTKNNWKDASMAIGLGRYNGELVYGVWADVLVGDLIVGEKLAIKNGDSSVTIDKNGITIKKGFISWEHVNAPEINEINGLTKELSSIKTTADEAKDSIATNITELDQKVAQYLNGGTSTSIGENYMISPYIGGGYLNITDENSQSQVVIDPCNVSGNGYIFQVKKQNTIMVGIDTAGNALFEGKIKTTEGSIGGWTISEHGISHSNKTDNNGLDNSLEISSQDSKIVARKIKKVPVMSTGGFEYNVFYDNMLHITPGRFEYLNRVIEDQYGDIIKESSLFYIEDGCLNISYHFGTIYESPSNKIRISSLGLYLFDNHAVGHEVEDNIIKIPKTMIESSGIYIKSRGSLKRDSEHSISHLHGFREYGKPLKELYSVVKTGVNDLVNKEAETIPWIEQTASFDVVYESEPFVNVMFCGSLPEQENIVFIEYIGNSEDGYTGFKYMVRTKDPEFNYRTKWWAVGNVRP